MHNYDEHHTHNHAHADGSVHAHDHKHEHGQENDHSHDHVPVKDEKEEAKALLNYMLEHNEHHAEELVSISDSLRELDIEVAAESLDKAISFYKKGNEMLEKALLATREV